MEYPNRETDVYDKYKLEDDYYAILRKTKGVKHPMEQEFTPVNMTEL
jgi:hypothetical protein